MEINLKTYLARLSQAGQNLLLYRWRWLELLFVLIILGVMMYAITTLLFTEPELPDSTLSVPLSLKVETIDKLELWVEERQTAYEQGLVLPNQAFFQEQ